MGLTHVKMRVKRDREAERSVELEFLVDSGASFTVAPGDVLRDLGVEVLDERDFRLADGQKVTRKLGDAYFEFGDHAGMSRVVFGEAEDSNLLGAITLETFGLVLDPFKRELKPMRMLLM